MDWRQFPTLIKPRLFLWTFWEILSKVNVILDNFGNGQSSFFQCYVQSVVMCKRLSELFTRFLNEERRVRPK